MNYAVIAASIKETLTGYKTKSLIAALLLAASSAFCQTTITDIDGNVYNTVGIGNQLWMKENLKVTHYNNGTPIPRINIDSNWVNAWQTELGAWNFSGDDSNNLQGHGLLYNWYAVNDTDICPIGWHVPTNDEWNQLGAFLGPDSIAGGKLKDTLSSGYGSWWYPNAGANNQSNFTAWPSGYTYSSGVENGPGAFAVFWTSTFSCCNNFAYGRWIWLNDASLTTYSFRTGQGQSVRCLSNSPYNSCTGTTITSDGPTTFCAGNSVNLTSDVVGGTYQWKKNGVNISTNGTSRTYKATATGSYSCVAICNGTALTSNAIAVTSKTNAFASVTASGATSFCLGDSLTLNCTNLGSNYSVQWYRTNISMENATNYSLVVKQPGTYKVVTKNLTNGCSRISGSAITTSVNCRIAGDVTSASTSEENTNNTARLIDNELSHGVHIYPNPNNGSFNFTYDGEETGDGVLQIINTMGQSIYSSAVSIQEGGYTQEINLGDNYTKGFYIVRLLINGGYNDSRVMVR